ncbi:MAG: LD-carboxypeptidase [Elusimicrobia bacterium]|nr:LD-carboxypeptidase [Elusimicrobiota bacterium]
MKISTISPSWLVTNRVEFSKGIRTLEKWGFTVADKKFPVRALSPREKARQIHNAFSDKSIGMVLALRGGYSSMKVLPYLDFKLIKRYPKLFAGFSDLSTMLNAIYERTDIITLHAPMVINFEKPTDFTVSSFMNAVNGFPEKDLFKGAPVEVIRAGTVRGTLKGGNLVTLTALIGTDWETQTDGCIVFFEDVDEKIHQIDRYLTQWALRGKLQKIKGLILGDFRNIKNNDVVNILKNTMKIHIPVVHCPYIGHVKNKITLPVGATVELSTRTKSLRLVGHQSAGVLRA